jgi:hypothetical protein
MHPAMSMQKESVAGAANRIFIVFFLWHGGGIKVRANYTPDFNRDAPHIHGMRLFFFRIF